MTKYNIYTRATKLDRSYIYIDCPLCKKEHRHGCNGDWRNRNEWRIPHCLDKDGPSVQFCIVIDDDTERDGKFAKW
jgi:hypothetical protein